MNNFFNLTIFNNKNHAFPNIRNHYGLPADEAALSPYF